MATLANARRDERLPSNAPWIGSFPEAASQTYAQNGFVYLVSGKITVCAAAGADVASGVPILGRAMLAASGTTDAMREVLIASNGQLFELPATNDNATVATAVAHIGTAYELRSITTTGVWAYNTGGTSDTKVVPLKFQSQRSATTIPYPAQEAGETSGTAMCAVIAAQRQFPV